MSERKTGSEVAPTAPAEAEPAAARYEDESERVVAILGAANRGGHWEPPGRISVFALLGGVKLDFREADLLEGETLVEVFALLGGAEILVPRDIDVESSGTGVMGGFTYLSQRGEPGAPLLTIRGLALMGGVEVKAG